MSNVTRLPARPRPPRNEVPAIEEKAEDLGELLEHVRLAVNESYSKPELFTAETYASLCETLHRLDVGLCLIASMATDHTCETAR